MKSAFDNNKNSDYSIACEIADKDFSHSELIKMLKTGNVPQKQIAALKLDKVNDFEESKILIDNLTGCDGKIREAVALKINSLVHNKKEAIYFFKFPEIFANASIDINANICRSVIDSVSILKLNKNFTGVYISKILRFIYETFKELDNFIYRDKKYIINKQLFKLYWCLESLKLFTNDVDRKVLYSILERCSVEKEYTIREKAAQIVILIESDEFNILKNKLMNDENYYVKAVFCTK